MSAHVYRSHAADQGRQGGGPFKTVKNTSGTWEVMPVHGGEQAGKQAADFAFANNEWCAWGEAGFAPISSDADPTPVGALVVKCRYEQLRQHGDPLPDFNIAKVWLRVPGGDLYIVEPLNAERWDVFAGKAIGTPMQQEAAALAEQHARQTAKITMSSTYGKFGSSAPEPKPRAATGAGPARSTGDSPVKRVHAICDSMPNATRKEIVNACIAAGINKSTAGTQYYHWNKARQ